MQNKLTFADYCCQTGSIVLVREMRNGMLRLKV